MSLLIGKATIEFKDVEFAKQMDIVCYLGKTELLSPKSFNMDFVSYDKTSFVNIATCLLFLEGVEKITITHENNL